MAVPPNFVGATARMQGENVRISLASPPVGWGNGFEYSLSLAIARGLALRMIAVSGVPRAEDLATVFTPDFAEAFAAELNAAAKINRLTKHEEQSASQTKNAG